MRLDLAPCAQAPSDRGGAACSPRGDSSLPAGGPREGVGDVDAAAYGRVTAALEKAGTPIGPLDTLIAAQAASLGVTLVTNNTREFSRVPGLEIEDWTGG